MVNSRIIMRRCMGKYEQEQLTLEYCATEKALAGWQALFCIQNPRHCGGVKKSLSGEQRKEAPNVIIY